MKRIKGFVTLFLGALLLAACTQQQAPENNGDGGITPSLTGKVLILDTTVTGGASSPEAVAAAALGLTVDVVDGPTWTGMSASDFAEYRAIILGDPTCRVGTSSITAAESNAAVWGPVLDGNIILIGTDPTFHKFLAGAQAVIDKGVEFAVDEEGKTGAYITLSCYYNGVAALTPVPLLDHISSFGTFTNTGVPGCFNSAVKVVEHPALDGITDAGLSGWGCSVHEAFDTWPADFEVLGLATTGDAFTAPDGTKGTPYILARGESLRVVSDISLDPTSAVNPVGTEHTVTATVTEDDLPLEGVEVTFEVIAGPHIGTTGTDTTNASGLASFSWTGTSVGTDLIVASFLDARDVVQRSNTASKEWVESDPDPDPDKDVTSPTCELIGIDAGPPVTLSVMAQDLGSGLDTINVIADTNAVVTVPAFLVGTTDALTVTAEKIDPDAPAQVELEVIDVDGNITRCDPVIVQLEITSSWGRASRTVNDIPAAEGQLSIVNGEPGVDLLTVQVNSGTSHSFSMGSGDRVEGNASADMSSSNTAELTAFGEVGSAVLVMFHDGSAGVASLPTLRLPSGISLQGAGVDMNWN